MGLYLFLVLLFTQFFSLTLTMEHQLIEQVDCTDENKKEITVLDVCKVRTILDKIAHNYELIAIKIQTEQQLSTQELYALYKTVQDQKLLSQLFIQDCSHEPLKFYFLLPLCINDVSIEGDYLKELVEVGKIDRDLYEQHVLLTKTLETIAYKSDLKEKEILSEG
jgi:hypothetical protein